MIGPKLENRNRLKRGYYSSSTEKPPEVRVYHEVFYVLGDLNSRRILTGYRTTVTRFTPLSEVRF